MRRAGEYLKCAEDDALGMAVALLMVATSGGEVGMRNGKC